MATATSRFLTVLLGGAGAVHLARPAVFDPIVPRWLPGPPRAWTYASGVAELGVAALIAAPSTRRIGGAAAAALFVAVFPANLRMTRLWWDQGAGRRAIAVGRLPLQAVLIAQAAQVAREG